MPHELYQQLPSPTVTIRTMTVDDLPLCRHLVEQAGWNQLDQDWLRAMELEPAGCFVAEAEGQPVATTTVCCFGQIAWIAMVLVDKQMRGRGIAKDLLRHAIQYCEEKGMRTIRLDATALGKGLYQTLGFEAEYEVVRYAGNPVVDTGHQIGVRPLFETDLAFNRIAEFDQRITQTDRRAFLHHLVKLSPYTCYYQTKNGSVAGYAACRAGANAVQIGPAIALTSHDGFDLLHAITSHFQGKKAYIDVPTENEAACQWLEAAGFTEQRRFTRMYLGDKIQDTPHLMWASSGPEKG
jgi:ribosomal protein S18 acetylase RimI-like enzyme